MDSVFTSVHRSVVLLDLVDEAWAADYLSDDGECRPDLLPCFANSSLTFRRFRLVH